MKHSPSSIDKPPLHGYNAIHLNAVWGPLPRLAREKPVGSRLPASHASRKGVRCWARLDWPGSATSRLLIH